MTTNNHPAHGPVSLERLHQIREILSKASAQSDGGNLGYAMADAVKVIDGVLESIAREQVRCEHAAWSQATFGDVGPVGPLKHLSKEALEAAAEPGDLSEWADMQFLLWDAQRRTGISDEQITQAMVEKLAVNKQRKWPEPKDGEPRLHIKEQPAPVTPDGWIPVSERMPEVGVKVLCFPVEDEPINASFNGQLWLQDISWSVSDESIDNVISCNVTHWMPLPAAPQQEVKLALEHGMQRYAGAMQKLSEGDK
ncbi:TPA: DUF550 domain-containing protein [Citrobacter freundii]|nr:DUF550 domain-containing protein [Citrobacter freundii]HEE9922579.1 DUF550 domain-containing protein [Citrobacter freundii]